MKVYTQEDLKEMSDFEINTLVAHAKGWQPHYWHHLPNYCNNWSDMGPLIVETKIAVTPSSKLSVQMGFEENDWCASVVNFASWCENPLRAAAIVYILIKQK